MQGSYRVEWNRDDLIFSASRTGNQRALANIESLTPKFLAHVPRDEFGNGRMRLLVLPAGSAIYSVGENERDEQGRGDDIAYSFQDIVARTNVSGSSP